MPPRTLRDLFVDRDRQLTAFRRMLDGSARKRVMIIRAPDGMGKSWLLQMFAHPATETGLPLARFDFADGLVYDALALVRRARDMLGEAAFPDLEQTLREASTPRVNISVDGPPINVNVNDNTLGDNANITIGDVGVNLKNSQFIVQTDNPVIRQALEDRINRAFFEGLATLAATARPVFLFDSYERTSIETERWVAGSSDRWISGELLLRIRDGRLPNAIAVLAGSRTPEFGPEWSDVLGQMEIQPLSCDDVRTYLRERRGLTALTDNEAQRLCEASAGLPNIMALLGDNLERALQPKVQDDEW